MTINWTEQLRDALISAVVAESTVAGYDADELTDAVVALASIPIGAALDVNDGDPNGSDAETDVAPAPTGDYVAALIDYHYGLLPVDQIRRERD